MGRRKNNMQKLTHPQQSTKVLSPGLGSRPLLKVLSSFSSLPKLNTTLVPLVQVTSQPVSQEVLQAVSLRLTLPWVSALA